MTAMTKLAIVAVLAAAASIAGNLLGADTFGVGAGLLGFVLGTTYVIASRHAR